MTAQQYASAASLTDAYRSGRGKQKPTLQFWQIAAGIVDINVVKGVAREATLAFRKDNAVIGAVGLPDIERVLTLASLEGDTEKNNPNLTFLKQAFEEIEKQSVAVGNPAYQRTEPGALLPNNIRNLLGL